MNRKPWTPEEDRIIIESYPTEEAAVIGCQLGRGLSAVYSRAAALGVKKDPSYHAVAARKGTTHPNAVAHRFQKGRIPFNKGKKMPPEVYAKAAPTMFKPGHKPHNHYPVGTERVDSDGYIGVKVAEPNKWKAKHRIIWEEANGPIPKGYNIQFRNGDRKDVRLDNLYIISRADQLRNENTMTARYPEELVSAIRAKATLKRQITMQTKTKTHNEE